MSNSYFQFKKFRIEQQWNAMKVSTDACILGAYARFPETGKVLDIGTGMGLLSLMGAQRSNCEFDAIEIDRENFSEAVMNIGKSPWKHRIRAYNLDIKKYHPGKKYDAIICNPPFFSNHLKSPSDKKNQARHSDDLTMSELIEIAIRLLNPSDGKLSILLPVKESAQFAALAAKNNLHPENQLLIRDNPLKPMIRMVTIYSFHYREKPFKISLTIKDADGKYSKPFIELMNEFYLYL